MEVKSVSALALGMGEVPKLMRVSCESTVQEALGLIETASQQKGHVH